MDEVEDAATGLVIARAMRSKLTVTRLARKLKGHQKVAELYGVDD